MAHVVAVGVYTDTASGTTHNVPLPTLDIDGNPFTILADDLLVAGVGMDGNPSIGWPGDWTELLDAAGASSTCRGACAYKWAAGGESGTIAVTTTLSEGGGIRILVIRDADPTTAPDLTGSSTTGTDTAPDPANLDPSGWGVEATLWIGFCVWDGNVDCTAAPANYSDLGVTRWANAAGAGVASATRELAAASENPGPFTLASTEQWRAWVLAVRPSASEEHSGSSAVTGGGGVTSSGAKAAASGSAVSGGGEVASAGQKSAAGASAVSGGGLVTSAGGELVEGSSQVTGGGGIASFGTKHASGSSQVSGGGDTQSAGAASRSGSSWVTGGGAISSTGGAQAGPPTAEGPFTLVLDDVAATLQLGDVAGDLELVDVEGALDVDPEPTELTVDDA